MMTLALGTWMHLNDVELISNIHCLYQGKQQCVSYISLTIGWRGKLTFDLV